MTLLYGRPEENQEHDFNTDNNIPRMGSLRNCDCGPQFCCRN